MDDFSDAKGHSLTNPPRFMQPSNLGSEYDHLLDSLPTTEMQVLSTARTLEIQGDAKRACALLAEACRCHPSPNLRKGLAALHQKHGNFAESARVIRLVLAEKPDDVPSILLLAESQIQVGNYGGARQTLKRAQQRGASKLRVFKLERQLEELCDETTIPDGEPTGPVPPLERNTTPDGEVTDEATEPRSAAIGPSTPPTADSPTDSAVFEDGTFSNLSSFDLAAGASQLQESGTPSIFDTLVDTYNDDPADRSFDDLLMDLGVPVDETHSTDPDTTAAIVSQSRQRVASEWGLDASAPETAGPADATAAINLDALKPGRSRNETDQLDPPREETPRLHQSPSFSHAPGQSDDDFADEKTEMFDRHAPNPSSTPPRPDNGAAGFSAEPPTRVETPRVETPRGEAVPGPAKRSKAAKHPQQSRRPVRRPDPSARQRIEEDKRPLPPPVSSDRDARRRPTAKQNAVEAPGHHQPALGHKQSPRHTTHAGVAVSFVRSNLKFIIPGVLVALVLASAGVVFSASYSATDNVERHLTAYREAVVGDTYTGYLQGKNALLAAISAHSFLGASADELLAGAGLMSAYQTARDDALVELAMLDAMIEYRYEHIDTHDSRAFIERATEAAAGDPRLEIARAYRLLSTGRADEAVDALLTTRKNFPGLEAATTAMVQAHLDAGNTQSASMTSSFLDELDEPSVFQHYVLGLVERREKKDAADARFRHIIETLSPKHLDARIERSYTLRTAANDTKKASALLEETLGKYAKRASPLQLARAHVAMGDLYVEAQSRARAEEQFRKAIKAVPQRSEIYVPLIELYRDDGRLDTALELIDDAASQGAQSPDLALRRAELLRLTGQPEAALSALEDDPIESARAHWLTGMVLLDLERLDEARNAFAAAAELSDEFAPARAYQALVEELGSRDDRDEIASALERVVEKFPTQPDVLRAGALGAMHVARMTKSRAARQTLLERAGDLLERAMKNGGNQAVLLFDRCRQQMLAGDASNASISCGKARRLNDTYLPGLLTMADLELRRGRPDSVLEMLEKLGDRFPDDPRISQWKALAHLERFELERAEKAINRWAGTQAAKAPLHLCVEGRLAFARNRYTAALGYFQRAHEKAPDDARAALYYAHTLTRLGEHDRAVEIVRNYTTDLEFEPIAWIIYGEARRRQGRFGDARENLGLALRKLDDAIVPAWRTSQAYTQLALAWADRYGFDHRFVGRNLYRGAKRGDADFPPLNATRGAYYLKLRRPDRAQAAKAFEKVIEFEPFNCDALRSLRAIYEHWESQRELGRIERLHTEHCED